MGKKVGEHITLDIIGTEKEYAPKFFDKLVYKIAKQANVSVLEICSFSSFSSRHWKLLIKLPGLERSFSVCLSKPRLIASSA